MNLKPRVCRELAKAFDSSAVLGDLVPKNELAAGNWELSCVLMMNPSAWKYSRHVVSFNHIISFVSRYFSLRRHLIYTGTPAGVGPVQIGDRLVGKLNGKATRL